MVTRDRVRWLAAALLGLVGFQPIARPQTSSPKPAQSAQPADDARIFIEDDEFDVVKLSRDDPRPIVVWFWAKSCGPCRMGDPVLRELARDHVGKTLVYRVDVDKCPSVTEKFNVTSIPLTVVVRRGREVDRLLGVQPRKRLEEAVAK